MAELTSISDALGGVWDSVASVYNRTSEIGRGSKPANVGGNTEGIDGSFNAVFKSYMGLVNDTNDFQVQAERLQLDFAAGRTDDMLAVTLAQEKAFTSLSFTTQVTNKLIEAYREISRIQL